MTKEEARGMLGISPSKVMLLAMATSGKFGGYPVLLDILSPVLDACPDAIFIGVGAFPFNCYPEKFNRDQMLFTQPLHGRDASHYHIAADIHIDSFPFTSLTSALETMMGSGGVVLGYCPWNSTSTHDMNLILCIEPDDYAPSSSILTHATIKAYQQTLTKLLSDPALLHDMQQKGRQGLQRHMGQLWTEEMNGVYDQVLKVDRRPRT